MIFQQLVIGTIEFLVVLFNLLVFLILDFEELVLFCVFDLVGVGVLVELDELVDEFTFGYFVEVWHEDLFLPVAHVYYLLDVPLLLQLVAVHGQV